MAVNHLGTSKDDFKSMLRECSTGYETAESEEPLIDVVGDISVPETGTRLVSEVVNKWGRIDVLVSSAGVCKFEDFLS